MAEVIALRHAVVYPTYSNVISVMVLSDFLFLVKLLKNGENQPEFFDIMFGIYY